VSIAVELVTDPSIIILDEPTSGLDSFSALSLTRMLHKFARDHGKTVIAAIHQPSSEAFHKYFDRLLLMQEGHIVYQGPTCLALQHFVSLGVEIKGKYKNPADVFMRALCVSEGTDQTFINAYDDA
jgi:ABC-type multidrug transport system ATPase subunit